MTHRETDLDRLTALLGQCLGRIDEQANRLRASDEVDDLEVCDALEREAAVLQELIGSVLGRAARGEAADLNRIVEQSLRGSVAELDRPVVVRTRLAPDLPRAAAAPGQLAYAVQRSLMLVLAAMLPGGEIAVTTRAEGDDVLLEIESGDTRPEAHFADRAATLQEFVSSLGGTCHLGGDGRGACLVELELPAALVADG